ncbi:hypothetical protein B0181_03240 [Moraxella caviae]|uniref:Cell division protein FtsA n=1 Tax=Moraxella caviae TaxID=34060 RepID=A0A1T0A7N6_9GAMM|nr:cell division FtsA domain-containing protein [Moraxella caviae]OOR91331.1 hypothetical protein B0181_03240 [Moraxella caviae]STZ13941.1 Cell division protein FtsA [Moraxella caviae]VEW11123.1 Cell division protein FtsA [Moraxella caviae]
MPELQVAIHLSSTAVYTVIGYFEGAPENRRVKIVAVGLASNEGFVGGQIRNREHLAQALHKSIQEASDMAGVKIHDACLSFASPAMASKNDFRTITVGRTNEQGEITEHGIITQEHLTEAYEMALDELVRQGLGAQQITRQAVYVDGEESKDAIGQYAAQVQVANYVMSLPESQLQQLSDIVESSGAEVHSTLFDGVVSAEYALSAEERSRGVCFIDIGASTTKVCVYYDDILLFSRCFATGGNMVDMDISADLKLSLIEAESLKVQHGTVSLDPMNKSKFLPLKRRSGGEITIMHYRLTGIIAERYRAIFNEVFGSFDEYLMGIATSGVVLAGGAAKMDGLANFLSENWGVPVRMTHPNAQVSICPKNLSDDNITLLKSYLEDNKLHSVVGSLLYQQSDQFLLDQPEYIVQYDAQGLFDKVSHGWQTFVQNIRKWF